MSERGNETISLNHKIQDNNTEDEKNNGVKEELLINSDSGDTISNTVITERKSHNKQTFAWRIRHDQIYRRKFIRTIFMWWASTVFGWTTGQIGPSLLDLQMITKTTLEKASAFLTSGSVGYLCGSMTSGFLHKKMNGDLLLFLCITGNVIMTVVVPWCSLYEVMVGAMLIRHIFFGAYDTVINAGMMQTWHGNSKFYMQVLHLSFAIGGILSPMATAPFLFDANARNSTFLNSSHNHQNKSTNEELFLTATEKQMYNFQIQNSTLDFDAINRGDNKMLQTTSNLYIAFIITSCLLVTAALPFLLLFINSRTKNVTKRIDRNISDSEKRLPLVTKFIILLILVFLACFDVAIEKGTHEFLTTFSVKQFDWSKTDSSYLNSLFWAAYAFGRFIGIFVIQFMSPSKMIFTNMLMLMLSYIGLLLSSLFDFDKGLWICVPISGCSISVIFPTLFTWTEIKLLPVTGAVASLFVVSGSVGSMVNPLAIGSLMDTITPMFFCYLLLGESIILFLLYIIASLLSKRVMELYGTPTHEEIYT